MSEVPVDVRIISATHQDLERLMQAGSFREDLYYRLNVLPVTVESLATRTKRYQSLSIIFVTYMPGRRVPLRSPQNL